MPTFRLGDMVRIKSGAFAAFTGRIDGINQTRSLLKVKVNLNGRGQTAKIKFSEVEKLEFKEAASSKEG
jgi:transcriptional antiterminator NusG